VVRDLWEFYTALPNGKSPFPPADDLFEWCKVYWQFFDVMRYVRKGSQKVDTINKQVS
jgi:hypothetical protein